MGAPFARWPPFSYPFRSIQSCLRPGEEGVTEIPPGRTAYIPFARQSRPSCLRCSTNAIAKLSPQGRSKVGPGHCKPEIRRPKAERNPKTEVRTDSHPGGAAANRIRPFSEFGLRSSDFRAAEHDPPSTGRTLEQPCGRPTRVKNGFPFRFAFGSIPGVAGALRLCPG